MKEAICSIGQVLAAFATVLFIVSVTAPDGTVGSPRSILVALAGLFVAIAAYIAHECAHNPNASFPESPPP